MPLRNVIIEGLQNVFPSSGRVLLTNYPNHSNVGDLAIALAEMSYLQLNSGVEVDVALNYGKISEKWFDKNEINVVAIQGGGSLGRIWTREEKSRKECIDAANSVRAKLVQFPQSVNFANGKPVETLEAFRASKNKHIFVRDLKSQEKLHNEGIETHLIPDLCHLLELQKYFDPPIRNLQIVRRKDKESQNYSWKTGLFKSELDWKSISPIEYRIEKNLRRLKNTGASLLNLEKANIFSFKAAENYAQKMVFNGVKKLSESEIVVTDRLHVALLAAHGNRKTRLVLDRYTKIQDYFDTWGPIENVKIYKSWEGALRNHGN
jgi:pyruvyl transferase EpsO